MTGLLVFIYAAFISLGLPDSMLGTSWTVMHLELGAPIALAGLIGMVISGGTILSSLSSSRVIRRFGTWRTVTVSVSMTMVALFGFSVSRAVWMLFVFSVPLGLGAGAVDAALNNFVALHYKPRHMNWLHCFWGIGAMGGPLVIAAFLGGGGSWARRVYDDRHRAGGACGGPVFFQTLWKPEAAKRRAIRILTARLSPTARRSKFAASRRR